MQDEFGVAIYEEVVRFHVLSGGCCCGSSTGVAAACGTPSRFWPSACLAGLAGGVLFVLLWL